MVISDTIVAMLLTEARYKDFTHKEIADATKTVRGAALSERREPRPRSTSWSTGPWRPAPPSPARAQDHGFMYGRAFDDLDGHTWEIMWMDPAMIQDQG